MDKFKDFITTASLYESLMYICILVVITTIVVYIIVKTTSPWRKAKREARIKNINIKKEDTTPNEKQEEKKEVVQEEIIPIEPLENREQNRSEDLYVSPLILDRTKYEIALQEKLEKERQEKINRQAMETARLEMLKNKEFQSHAGYISTLQRFSKKEQLESQIAQNGKVDRDLLNTYLNEKSTSISEEFTNMSPELKAVILSDLMKRKY